ncbi:MAG: shikimate kinase [Phototrophicales bacterium]|nr:shikimate kinase [Phototrophicales bacterium]
MSMLLPFSERNLILTGYIGLDLSRIGRELATQFKMSYFAIDTAIADRAGMFINEIRANFGENRLKSLEADMVSEALLRRQAVIYATGRTLIQHDYLPRFLETGEVFCLTINLDAMLHRLHLNMGAQYHNPHDRAVALAELHSEWAIRKKTGIREIHILPDMPREDIMALVTKLWRELAIASR